MLLAAVMVLSLTGCKETLKKVAQKVTGHSEEVQEEDTTRWAEATTDPLIIQGIADASAKYATATADGCLYAVFNGIWSRNTGYFTVPGGSLNIMACGTAEGTQKFKVALWKKGGRRRSVCAGQHLLRQNRWHRLPLHHFRAGPGGAVPRDHLL